MKLSSECAEWNRITNGQNGIEIMLDLHLSPSASVPATMLEDTSWKRYTRWPENHCSNAIVFEDTSKVMNLESCRGYCKKTESEKW